MDETVPLYVKAHYSAKYTVL